MIGQYAFGFTTDFKEVLVKSYASDAMTLEGIEQLEIDPASMVIPEGYVLSALPEM